MIDRMGRKRALTGLTLIAVGALTLLAPATAFALPSVTDTIGSGTSTVGSAVDSTTETVTGPVKDTVESSGNAVGTVVDKTGDAVDQVSPGTPVGSTKKIVENTAKKTAEAIGGAKETADGVGGAIFNPDLSIKNPLGKKRDGRGSHKEKTAAQQKTAAAQVQAALAERSDKVTSDAKDAALANLERNRREQGTPVALTAPPPRETFLTQLADAAVEATKKLAFPLGLALMVGAFLMVQGRIDRKDAKLALAPIDSEQDLLSFQ